ncbi:MAG: Hsp20/alpha crystallin family protein [Candidatus Sericytochromatia bacterium]|nr:Hsp20/alpha crystallin family protein [Candidatus Sericytochromatia bacterium]
MALMRWEPLGELESMRRMMDRMMEHMGGSRLFGHLPALEGSRAFMPNVEVYTGDNEVVATAELPGLDPEDVEVEITEDAIHLCGECKREEEIREDSYFRSERQYGRFDRTVALPERIKEAEARATFKNGVLTIRAPLAEPQKKAQARKLKIEG